MGLHEVLDSPVTDNEPVQGVCEGRMVAYWPSDSDKEQGLRAPANGYVPAVITSAWNNGQAVAMPLANIRLFTDGCNVPDTAPTCLGSCRYSSRPAKGSWTWIPKA